MIKTVHFLELAENINHIINQVDQIPFDIISKYINLVLKKCAIKYYNPFDILI